VFLLTSAVALPAVAEEQTLHLAVIGPDGPSPFKPQLHVQVTNESFTSFPLLENLKSSELMIDGRTWKRQDAPFDGAVGLPPQGSWEGCLTIEEYAPDGIPAGHHHLLWHLGKARSEEIRVKFYKPEPEATIAKERLLQVEALRGALVPGLSKTCVENWLAERDGGLEIAHAVRYYVDPDVKVLVPYDQTVPEPRIKSPVKIYIESRVAD
jgi:hypothetical protein